MLNTYIKNRGISKTIVYDNNKSHVNEIDWDADYDGDIANLSLTAVTNGKREHFDVSLDNNDLAEMLSLPSVNVPIHKRLEADYINPKYKITSSFPSSSPLQNMEQIMDILSPKSNEEFIVPLTIDRKFTPKKHRKRHITHKVYKKRKSSHKSNSKNSKSKYKTKSSHKSIRRSHSTNL